MGHQVVSFVLTRKQICEHNTENLLQCNLPDGNHRQLILKNFQSFPRCIFLLYFTFYLQENCPLRPKILAAWKIIKIFKFCILRKRLFGLEKNKLLN